MRDLHAEFRKAWDLLEPLAVTDFPRWRLVRQKFPSTPAVDVETAIRAQLNLPGIGERIRAGMRVALAVGSRGVANISLMVRTMVRELAARGADPFIIPAMGSHGGGTPEGQVAALAALGITRETAGAPIRSSFETIEIGKFPEGGSIFIDRIAAGADAVIPIARIKAHTGFRAPVESGLLKLLTIGLGKQAGAAAVHGFGMDSFAEHLMAAAAVVLGGLKVPFGVCCLENATEQTARIELVPGERIFEREPELLVEAKRLMGRLLVNDIDVLVVKQLGKNISGAGMDPNVTGRYSVAGLSGGASVRKLVALDVSAESHGNAIGMGLADIATARILDKLDVGAMYLNSITSTVLTAGKIPLMAENDRSAIGLGLRTCNRPSGEIRLVGIKNTLELDRIYISDQLWNEHAESGKFEALEGPADPVFDAAGGLVWF